MLMIVRPWEITKDVQRYVDLLSKFFEQWDFKLVPEKTVAVVFTINRKCRPDDIKVTVVKLLPTLTGMDRSVKKLRKLKIFHQLLCETSASLMAPIGSVANVTSSCRLCSSSSSELVIPLSRLVTVGDRSFAVAGPRLLKYSYLR